MIATSCNLCAKATTCATPCEVFVGGADCKRVIRVLERILGYGGSSGYDPEGMILGCRRQRRLLGDRLVGCSDCPKRLPKREMVEVTEEHESLTWFLSRRALDRCTE